LEKVPGLPLHFRSLAGNVYPEPMEHFGGILILSSWIHQATTIPLTSVNKCPKQVTNKHRQLIYIGFNYGFRVTNKHRQLLGGSVGLLATSWILTFQFPFLPGIPISNKKNFPSSHLASKQVIDSAASRASLYSGS